ncbi:MAG: ORF6C domain-containing protein [Clostridiales Family XIII bacterium]|nr:ORF6C domain-containing protein [Clostridia bacterium]MDY3011500.1 ORF6C domain-containing protein [Clostridiales Family XIII bacterium]
MNEIMKIGNQEITVKEYKGQRVVTFKDIDLCHERPEGTAKRNFNANAKYFKEGEDYFKVCADEIRTNKIMDISSKTHQDVIFITQKGYPMIAKSLNDDLAWKVQRELVNNYFSPQQRPSSPMEILKLEFEALKEIDNKVDMVNADLQDFKQDIPILGVEEVKITNAVKGKGIACLGGKSSAAYNDNSVRSKVYADIHRQLKREFGVTTYKAIKRKDCDLALELIAAYELPYVLQEQIETLNCKTTI